MSEEKPNITVTPRAIILDDTMVWLPYEEYQRLQKAIPIEYIQKWNNNYIADTMRNGRTIINQMLEDWEKENEV